MHGARESVYAGEKVRGRREVRSQGPEALSDEEGRGYVNLRSSYSPSTRVFVFRIPFACCAIQQTVVLANIFGINFPFTSAHTFSSFIGVMDTEIE